MSEAALDPQGPPRAGERLKAARERAGLSQTQVADQLRLSAAVIEALEQGNYAFIGAQVFVRGYLKRYAELVGEDPALAESAAQQHAWSDPTADMTSTRLRPLDGTGDRLRIGKLPLVVGAVLVCLWGIYWWAQRATAPRNAASGGDLVQEQVVAPPALGVAPGDTPAPAKGPAPATPLATPTPAAAPPMSSPAALPVASQPAAAAAAVKPAATTAPAAARPAAAADAGGARRHLRLNFHGESWTELYDAGGARLYWGLGEPGDLQSVSGTPPFKLILGNPGSVTVTYEGAALALPAPRGGTTLRVGIDARGALEPLR